MKRRGQQKDLSPLEREMTNQRMKEKLKAGEAIDVSDRPRLGPYYVLRNFQPDKDYCDAKDQAWIWSIGRRYRDGLILASRKGDLYQNQNYECLWLR
jgi:hypothetical protein